MSVQPMIDCLKKLSQLHQGLIAISEQKTEALKEGNTEDLQSLLVQERKHVQAVNQIETKRQQLTEEWEKDNQHTSESATMTAIFNRLDEGQLKQELAATMEKLTENIAKLRQQEVLNKQLTQQSLQFVQLSIDMIQPSMKTMNYGKTSGTPEGSKRSVFDSKA